MFLRVRAYITETKTKEIWLNTKLIVSFESIEASETVLGDVQCVIKCWDTSEYYILDNVREIKRQLALD